MACFSSSLHCLEFCRAVQTFHNPSVYGKRKNVSKNRGLVAHVSYQIYDGKREVEKIQESCSQDTMKNLVKFLENDLLNVFDEKGMDKSVYESKIQFTDPITKHDSLEGYFFNIYMQKHMFSPKFFLHSIKQTGNNEITTRWTVSMNYRFLPWNPELVFTGRSVYVVNPHTQKIHKHVTSSYLEATKVYIEQLCLPSKARKDYWDSLNQNDYFSFEGFLDVFNQFTSIYKPPDLETPSYVTLKRTAHYEVRKYKPFYMAVAAYDDLASSIDFDDVVGYLFGKDDMKKNMAITTPLDVNIRFALSPHKKLSVMSESFQGMIKMNETHECIAAALKFNGKVTQASILEKSKLLRSYLIRESYRPETGCMLVCYHDPNTTCQLIMRNEIVMCLEGFSLD